MNYANQKTIILDFADVAYNKGGNNEPFLHSLKWSAIDQAAYYLSGNVFKLWLYMFKWTGKGHFFFSPAALNEHFGFSNSTAQRCFKTLVSQGYLRLIKGSWNSYQFYPYGDHKAYEEKLKEMRKREQEEQ